MKRVGEYPAASLWILAIAAMLILGFCNPPPEDIKADLVTPTATTEMVVVIEAATSSPTVQATSEVLPTKTKVPTMTIAIATSTPKPLPTSTVEPTSEPIIVPTPEPTATQPKPIELPRAGGG